MKKILTSYLKDSNGNNLKVGCIYRGYFEKEDVSEIEIIFAILDIQQTEMDTVDPEEEILTCAVNPDRKFITQMGQTPIKDFSRLIGEKTKTGEFITFRDPDLENTMVDQGGEIISGFELIQNTQSPKYFIQEAKRIPNDGPELVGCLLCPMRLTEADAICNQCARQLPLTYYPTKILWRGVPEELSFK